MQLFSNLTALALAATSLKILDFSQTNAIDLAGSTTPGPCKDFNIIRSWPSITNDNNQVFQLQVTNFVDYEVFIPLCNTFWTLSGAKTGAPATRATLVSSSANVSSFTFSLVNPSNTSGPWNIIEASSGLALTAWDMDSRTSTTTAPITLQPIGSADIRQQFWLVEA